MRTLILLLLFSSYTAASTIQEDIATLTKDAHRYMQPETRDTDKVNKLNTRISKLKRLLMTHNTGVFIVVKRDKQMIYVYKDKNVVIKEKVILGKVGMPTPAFQTQIKSVIFNPYWNVPNDLALGFIKRMNKTGMWPGYNITIDGDDVSFKDITNSSDFRMTQNPGVRNALGTIKFDMPNEHGVYIHDTPKKKLFLKNDRRFSAGCIRMQYPIKLAALLLGMSFADITELIETKEAYKIKLYKNITVYVM